MVITYISLGEGVIHITTLVMDFWYFADIFLLSMHAVQFKHLLFQMKLILHYYFCQRIPLDFLQGDRFREAADSYIRPLLTKVYTIHKLFMFCLVYLLQN